MSIIGIASLPVLFLSLAFIYYHNKFIGLHNAYKANQKLLHELMTHKLELLLFFSQDIQTNSAIFFEDTELSQYITKLEEMLSEFDTSDEDSAELDDITKEIDDAKSMYNQSKEDLGRFVSKFHGKHLATFLADKASLQ